MTENDAVPMTHLVWNLSRGGRRRRPEPHRVLWSRSLQTLLAPLKTTRTIACEKTVWTDDRVQLLLRVTLENKVLKGSR